MHAYIYKAQAYSQVRYGKRYRMMPKLLKSVINYPEAIEPDHISTRRRTTRDEREKGCTYAMR